MDLARAGLVVLVGLCGIGCGDREPANTQELSSAASSSESEEGDGSSTRGTETGEVEGLELLDRLGGLWVGPVTMTPLGSFVTMNMDLRAADERTLFSRVDLDAANALRFAFAVETHDGSDRLVFRNGGLFGGLTRDTRTVLEQADGERYRFCALAGGCSYIDASFEFDNDEELLLDVSVMGEAHVYWLARRAEPGVLPESFPAEGPAGDGTQDFPPLPELVVDVSWSLPLAEPADLWVLLANQDCPLAGTCDLSRFIQVEAEAGATAGSVVIPQIHPGEYKATAVLDRDRNLAETFAPGSGDGVSLPNADVTVNGGGSNGASLTIVVDL